MTTLELVDTAEIKGSGQLRLMRRGDEFSIVFDDDMLMGSREHGSEEALAALACRRLGDRESQQLLIGGLGMGFTLGSALARLPANATVVVAELVPEVVTWAGGVLAHLFGNSLADPRVTVEVRDVHDVIVDARERFDAILLDVDNGPDGVIHPANDRLYCNWGLRAAYAALRPAGMIAIWSAYPDDFFVTRLKNAGFAVEEVTVRSTGTRKGVRHTIWLATKPGSARAADLEAARER